MDFQHLLISIFVCFFVVFKYVLKKKEKMPSKANDMDNISKQEEDTEKSNEHSVTLVTLNSTSQESSVCTKQINADVANVYNDKVSTADHQIRIKILNSTGDALSSTSSVMTNDVPKNICQDKIAGIIY